MSLRLVFMGTPDFAAASLKALLGRHAVAAVYTQPPRPAGRGQREVKSPVHLLAEEAGIPVATPVSLKGAAEQDAFRAIAADVAVVAAYGLILPRPVLEAPRLGVVNVHASLLPRWRGAAPIQRAVEAGDRESGVTIMQVEEGLDSGPMLMARAVPIGPETTGGALHDALAELGAEMIVAALDRMEAGTLVPVPQPAEGVTYARKLSKDEGRLDFSQPAVHLACKIRAFSPWPGAWVELSGTRIKVLAAEPVKGTGRPGAVLDDRLTVACGKGALRLLTVQRPGKRVMSAEELLRGFPIAPGTVLCPASS